MSASSPVPRAAAACAPLRATARVPALADVRVRRGERWIYSAGCNVAGDLSGAAAGRIDCELEDLDQLARAGAAIAILSHQGSSRDGSAGPLDHVAARLAEGLGRPVGYFPDCGSAAAREHAAALRPGELVLFGNTRLYADEERGSPALARALAALGERVAIGGFSKAHRAHASNVGLLRYRRGFATRSLLRELELLAPWADPDPGRRSVAVLGGLKREKLYPGLALARSYDLVIPGGAALNALLRLRGVEIADSALGDCDAATFAAARRALAAPHRAALHLPSEVLVDDGGPGRWVALEDGLPAGCAIVDFALRPWARAWLERLAHEGGRALLAGPPARSPAGASATCRQLLSAFAAPGVDALLLGGDTVAELPWSGHSSTGGGAALHVLATGTCPVVEALAHQSTRGGPCGSST